MRERAGEREGEKTWRNSLCVFADCKFLIMFSFPPLAESKIMNGVNVYLQHRTNSITPTKAPIFKGTTFIANFRPIEILNCIHLFSYRLIWDTRMSSARIMQRYGQYNLSFYAVFRGIGPIYEPRDSVGVQDVRCWGPNQTPQRTAFPNTELIDIAFRSIETAEAPLQVGKVRMHIEIGGFRIEWLEELQGCNVTLVGDVDLAVLLPTYIWNVLSRELPIVVGRLRSSMEQFGHPPFIVDPSEIVIIQMIHYFSLTRITTLRQHVSKSGSYIVVIDRDRMYPAGEGKQNGCALPKKNTLLMFPFSLFYFIFLFFSTGVEWPPDVEGEGAQFVQFEDRGSQLLLTVGPQAVGKEYIIVSVPLSYQDCAMRLLLR